MAVSAEPLDVRELRRSLMRETDFWTDIDVVERIGSTNTELATRARAGAAEGSVLLAEAQTAGRGRLDRRWVSPAGAGIAMSVLLRPATQRWLGWLPLLTGVAVVRAVTKATGVEATLKWPNDILIDGGRSKLGGILAEVVPRADSAATVVVGVGMNVSAPQAALPPGATSLALVDARSTDRAQLIVDVLVALAHEYRHWRESHYDPDAAGLRARYRAACQTIGRSVQVALPAGNSLTGTAIDVDLEGRLLLATDDGGTAAVAAGDVVHVR